MRHVLVRIFIHCCWGFTCTAVSSHLVEQRSRTWLRQLRFTAVNEAFDKVSVVERKVDLGATERFGVIDVDLSSRDDGLGPTGRPCQATTAGDLREVVLVELDPANLAGIAASVRLDIVQVDDRLEQVGGRVAPGVPIRIRLDSHQFQSA